MNIWFFIILIVTLALVMGPISMLRPTPAQKRKEELRAHASKQGVRFGMRRLPALRTDIDQSAAIPVYYLPPLPKSQDIPEWILMRTSYEHANNFYLEWDWQTEVRPREATCNLLKNCLPQLPASVTAISRGNMGLCVFWLEKEGKESLDGLIKILTQLHQTEGMSGD